MAWMSLIPLAFSAVKTAIDSNNAQSQDAAMDRAGAEKLRMMREGAGQMSQYRGQITPQILQAMENQMGAYGGAQSVLSQMYGGGAPSAGMHPPSPGNVPQDSGGMRPVAGRTQPAPTGSVLRSMMPGSAQPTVTESPIAGRGGSLAPSGRYMGFGGEEPAPFRLRNI